MPLEKQPKRREEMATGGGGRRHGFFVPGGGGGGRIWNGVCPIPQLRPLFSRRQIRQSSGNRLKQPYHNFFKGKRVKPANSPRYSLPIPIVPNRRHRVPLRPPFIWKLLSLLPVFCMPYESEREGRLSFWV